MADPKTLEEYDVRFQGNYYLSGEGLEVEVHLPCPFCAAPDFVAFKILEVDMVMKLEQVCKECQRGVRLETKPIAHEGVKLEWVQTQGEDPPSFLIPMRRATAKKGGDA